MLRLAKNIAFWARFECFPGPWRRDPLDGALEAPGLPLARPPEADDLSDLCLKAQLVVETLEGASASADGVEGIVRG